MFYDEDSIKSLSKRIKFSPQYGPYIAFGLVAPVIQHMNIITVVAKQGNVP